MLYKIAHILRDKFPYLWLIAKAINSELFYFRYRNKIRNIAPILISNSKKYVIKELELDNCKDLEKFFEQQPLESFIFFKPHAFNFKELQQLVRERSFLAYIVKEKENIVGYFFLRCTFTGKGYRGYITDKKHQRMGINRLMSICATEIATSLKLIMYGSISPKNTASMKSAKAVNDIKIIKTLKNGDYLVEFLPRK